jgi:hypothetical protein
MLDADVIAGSQPVVRQPIDHHDRAEPAIQQPRHERA